LDESLLIELFGKETPEGSVYNLGSYLIDSLARYQPLEHITAVLCKLSTSTFHKKASLPAILSRVHRKELLTALLEVTPLHRHSMVLSRCAVMENALPLLYRVVTDGEIMYRTSLFGLSDMLHEPTYPLILSCGSTETAGKGKSELLAKIFSSESGFEIMV